VAAGFAGAGRSNTEWEMRAPGLASAVLVGTFLTTATGLMAAEYFVPYRPISPSSEYLPPVNSPEARFQAQADIYQTEINNFQKERKRHETWNRENFEEHEFDQTIFNNREY
jgi:hypothetical protein